MLMAHTLAKYKLNKNKFRTVSIGTGMDPTVEVTDKNANDLKWATLIPTILTTFD
jgi:hypothetical protein